MFDRLPLPSQFDRIIVAGSTAAALVGLPIFVVLLVLLIGDWISGPEFIFWLAAAVIIVGALGSVLLNNLVHATLSLTASLLGIAAIYLLLATEFLALVQVLIYGGGVVILLLFGLMLTNAQDDPIVTDGAQKPFAAGVGLVLLAIFGIAALGVDWQATEVARIPFVTFGERLFRDFLLPVIIIAVLLDVALSGALINARRERTEDAAEGVAGEEPNL